MTYDNPLRVTYKHEFTPTSAATRVVAVPKGASRFRLAAATAALQDGSNNSTNAIEIGVAGDTDKFHAFSLAVTAANPAASHNKDYGGNDITDLSYILITIGADAGATGDTVEFVFVIDFF